MNRNRNAPHQRGTGRGENRQLLSLESILPHLQGVRRLANGGYMARCPVHDDTNPSLSLREENGKLLWKCFAGCSQEAVQRELERRVGIPRETDRPTRRRTRLTLADYARQKGLDAEKLRAWGYYDHRQGVAMPERDITGKLINLKIRLPEGSKNRFFYPVYRYPIPAGLWRLPEWKDADTIYLCEGETDMLTLWHADMPALGIQGAKKWHEAWWQYLIGSERIVIIPDNDREGESLVRDMANPCPDRLRERVQVLRLPDGIKDANERWLQVDANPERLKEALAACEVKPLLEYVDRPIESESQDEQESQDEPIELVLVLGHTREREVAHTIVPNLLYAERITIRAGESGVGKTTFALEIADALTRTGKLWDGTVEVQPAKVLWLDFDHSWGRLQEILERKQSCSWCVS